MRVVYSSEIRCQVVDGLYLVYTTTHKI